MLLTVMSDFSQTRIALEEDIRYLSFILSHFKKKELPRWSPRNSYTSDLSDHLQLCSQIADILNVGTGDDSAMSVMVSEPSYTAGRDPQIQVFIVSEKSSHAQSPFPSQSAIPPCVNENPSVHTDAGISGDKLSTTGASARSVEALLATAFVSQFAIQGLKAHIRRRHETVPVEQHIADVLALIQQKATVREVSTLVVRRCYRKIHRRLHADNLVLDNSQFPEHSGLVGLLKLWAKAEKEDDITTSYVPKVERRQKYVTSELEKLAPVRSIPRNEQQTITHLVEHRPNCSHGEA